MTSFWRVADQVTEDGGCGCLLYSIAPGPPARNAGLRSTEIAAIAEDGPVAGIDAVYMLLCRAADEMYSEAATLTDETLSAPIDTFGEVITRKYIVTIAWFGLLSLFLNAAHVPLETTDKIGDRISPLGCGWR